jgi:hypothetical protein
MMPGLGEREIELVAWGELREASGDAVQTASALRSLLSAQTPEEASAAYWQLENRIVVQGAVFEAAEAATAVVVAALAEPRPFHIRVAALELLFQILSGEPDATELARGNVHLVTRCRQRAREGLWVLIREFSSGLAADAAADVLRIIDEHHFDAFRAT